MSNPISVSQFNTYVHNIFLAEDLLIDVTLYGEVGEVSWSGNNVFFSIKDDFAVLNCVKFGVKQSDFNVKEGDMINVCGSPNFYVKGGRFTFNVSYIQPVGKGELYLQFLKLKEKLEKKGYFDESRKKPLPAVIRRVGVVSSETGAVIQDIIDVSHRRNPMLDIVLYPAKVQGDGADKTIVEGIKALDNTDVDVIIVARGGGSNEDLSQFNSELIADAIYLANKVIISAVGHEVDYTICDFVADLRAPTPSAAAEIVASDIVSFKQSLDSNKERMIRAYQNFFNQKQDMLEFYQTRMNNAATLILNQTGVELDQLKTKLINLVDKVMTNKEHDFSLLSTKLDHLNPVHIMQMGWARANSKNNTIVSVDQVDVGQNIAVSVSDGNLHCLVQQKEKK